MMRNFKIAGVTEPVELVKAMLTPGEYADLLAAVTEAQGYDVGMEDKVKEVKTPRIQ